MPDATPWEQGEIVGDWTYPICQWLETAAAQGEGICQEDTLGGVFTWSEENRKAHAQAQAQGKAKPRARTGRSTPALIVQVGERRICLYDTGRRHAGEHRAALLTKREPGRDKPLVRSDALSSNTAEEAALIRGPCLAHGRRKCTEIAEVFPSERAVVVPALKVIYEHDEAARTPQLSAAERFGSPHTSRVPVFTTLKTWLAQQTAERRGEPPRSVGKAIASLLDHWDTLTRVLKVPGAPLDTNVAERAVRLVIRQRKTSLFYASEHSADIASILTRVIATGVHAGVKALAYLVAVQDHRHEVFANPSAWLPWNYAAALVPS